jgi:DNA-binding response OmpR family regulator
VEGLEAGADDYLVKPFGGRELLARVRSTLRLSQMRQEVARQEALTASLREAVQARDEFLSVASHELKTPLTTFQLQLELIRRELGPASESRIAERVSQPATRFTRLAACLLIRAHSGGWSVRSDQRLGPAVAPEREPRPS